MSNGQKVSSEASDSFLGVNVPEVKNFIANFVYNYYLSNERVTFPKSIDSLNKDLPLSKLARYVTVEWQPPPVPPANFGTSDKSIAINDRGGKVLSEDNFFNPKMLTHFFSDVSAIEQGASDLENYSRLLQHDTESMFKMSQYQINETKSKTEDEVDPSTNSKFESYTENFSKLVDFPKSSLGLRVFDSNNKEVLDETGIIRSLTDSITLNVKLNVGVIPDIFKNSNVKNNSKNFEILKTSYSKSKSSLAEPETVPAAFIVENTDQGQDSIGNPYKFIGYIIDKFQATPNGFVKIKTFYIENPSITSYVDKEIKYGLTYLYSIRTVFSVVILAYPEDPSGLEKAVPTAVYLSSRPVSTAIECHENVPPPEPMGINFLYDKLRKRFHVTWDMPVNPQRDVKQFQVFRRRSIREPFELIAQYGFDTSEVGEDGVRYKTGERVDANNYEAMEQEYKSLVHYLKDGPYSQPRPCFVHQDMDFMIDEENFVSSEYIYAICSVDAHGLISNYSAQHHVRFDVFKNDIESKVICDAGSPRQYPNMRLKLDAFKDVIKISGDAARQVSVHFTPEYKTIRDSKNTYIDIVADKKKDAEAHYLLQLINLDNQKLQTIKIDVA